MLSMVLLSLSIHSNINSGQFSHSPSNSMSNGGASGGGEGGETVQSIASLLGGELPTLVVGANNPKVSSQPNQNSRSSKGFLFLSITVLFFFFPCSLFV